MPPDPAPGRTRLAGLVLARGAATAWIIAMPAAFANVVLAAQDPKPQGGIFLSFLVVLLGFFAGGWLAGREAPSQAAKHGALVGAIAYVPVGVIAVLGRLDRGEDVSLGTIIVTGLLAACLGTLGARFSAARAARRETT